MDVEDVTPFRRAVQRRVDRGERRPAHLHLVRQSGEEGPFLIIQRALRPEDRAFRMGIESGHDGIAVGRVFVVVALDERGDGQRPHDFQAFVRIGVVADDVAE